MGKVRVSACEQNRRRKNARKCLCTAYEWRRVTRCNPHRQRRPGASRATLSRTERMHRSGRMWLRLLTELRTEKMSATKFHLRSSAAGSFGGRSTSSLTKSVKTCKGIDRVKSLPPCIRHNQQGGNGYLYSEPNACVCQGGHDYAVQAQHRKDLGHDRRN